MLICIYLRAWEDISLAIVYKMFSFHSMHNPVIMSCWKPDIRSNILTLLPCSWNISKSFVQLMQQIMRLSDRKSNAKYHY